MLDAARSRSTSPGLSSRKRVRSFREAAACFVMVEAVVRSAGLASDAFQPDSRMADRLLEARFTARIAFALRSSGVGAAALLLPLESEMVRVVASLSARSSGETAGGFDLVEEAVRVAGWRILVAGGMLPVPVVKQVRVFGERSRRENTKGWMSRE